MALSNATVVCLEDLGALCKQSLGAPTSGEIASFSGAPGTWGPTRSNCVTPKHASAYVESVWVVLLFEFNKASSCDITVYIHFRVTIQRIYELISNQ